MPYAPGKLGERSIIIHMTGALCTQPAQVFQTPHAARVMQRFITRMQERNATLLSLFEGVSLDAEPGEMSEAALALTRVLGLLTDLTPEQVRVKAPDVAGLVEEPLELARLVEDLYDFWRGMERYLVFEGGADDSRDRTLEGHVGFIYSNQDLTDLVRNAYRQIQRNLYGYWPRVYRQVPAGANLSLLIDRVEWPCPDGPYQQLRPIRMVRLALLNPPVVLYPRANRRVGRFLHVESNPLERTIIDPDKWLCLPVRVGKLNMLVYFDRDYMSLATSLVNLFELGGHYEAREKPDGILVFGVHPAALGDDPTVYHVDEANDLVVAAIAKSEAVDYFGYFKKMLLTMHNVIMMRRKLLPIHGAMCILDPKQGHPCRVILVGDSAAGKSESLEAFRVLADDWLRDMTIIFDDMGAVDLSPEGNLVAYGTEIGAFVRLDDLDPGYAFGRIDRSIFMNPHRQNARVVLPISDYSDVVAGTGVDMLLYANNYEDIDETHPLLDYSADPGEALDIFRKGLRASKGTTDETGVVGTYFGNPFGCTQFMDLHEPIAHKVFEAAFATGVKVGQLRTRLGLDGWEREGPMEAARALFEEISRG